jgi:hypothetical protein
MLRRLLFRELDSVGAGLCRGLLRRDVRVRLGPKIVKRGHAHAADFD